MCADMIDYGRLPAGPTFEFRRAERRRCRIEATILTAHGETGVTIIDIAAGGLALLVDPLLPLKPGERIMVRQQTLGEVRCIIRWGLHPRYGVQFDPPGRTPSGAQKLYGSLPPNAEAVEPGQILNPPRNPLAEKSDSI
jgi:hypothetical protein